MSHPLHSHLHLVPSSPEPSSLTIDCASCVARCTAACRDCVVSHLVGTSAVGPVVLDPAEAHAVDLLTEAGLAPPNRFVARSEVG